MTRDEPIAGIAEAELELARGICASHLAHHLASLFGVPERKTWNAMTYVPDNLLMLLDCPEGWAILANILAADLKVPLQAYAPVIH